MKITHFGPSVGFFDKRYLKLDTSNDPLTNSLNIEGIISISGEQTIYNAQAEDSFNGTLIIGNGGVNLSHAIGEEGYNNTALGINSLVSNTTGRGNIAIGSEALFANLTGIFNVAIGANALKDNLASGCTAIGQDALQANTTGINNSAIGREALNSNLSGSRNMAVGYLSLFSNTTGFENIAIGALALFANIGGVFNVAIGESALKANTTSGGTAIGHNALEANTTGSNNSAIGRNALQKNTIGSNNTAVGRDSLLTNLNGTRNMGLGYLALFSNSTGSENSAIGALALFANITGSESVAIGNEAGRFISDGSTANTTPQSCTYIGSETKALTATDSNSLVLGFQAIGIGTNTVVIGNDSILVTELKGDVGLGTSSPNSKLEVVGPISTSLTTKTANYTITDADSTVLLDGASNTVTASLPTAVGITGRKYVIKSMDDTFTTDVATNGSETIDGSSANFGLAKDEVIEIQSTGTGWVII